MDTTFLSIVNGAVIPSALGLKGLGPGKKKGKEDIVWLSESLVQELRQLCWSSMIINPFVVQIVMMAVSGITVKLHRGREEMTADEKMQYYIDKVFLPFVRRQGVKIFERGVISYSRSRWEKDERLWKPHVLREGRYQIGMTWNKDERRYGVYRQKKTSNTGTTETTVSKNAWALGVELWEPRDDGSLNSPFAILLPALQKYNRLWEWYIGGVSGYVKPLLVFGGSDSGSSTGITGDPLDEDHHLPDDVSELHRYKYSLTNEERRKQYEISKATHLLRQMGVRIEYDAVSQTNKLTSDSRLSDNIYVNPVNETLQGTVTPSPIPDFQSATADLRAMILETLLTPGNSKFQEKAGISATAELQLRNINDRVRQLQQLLAPPLERILEHMLEDVFISSLSDRYFELEEMQKKPLKPEEKTRLAKEEYRIELTFDYTPLTTYDALKKLYDDNIIDHETFGLYGLQVVGIPVSEKVKEEKVEELLRKKRKMEEILNPPELNQGAQKSSSSSSSSSSARSESLKGGGQSALKKKRETPLQ